MTPLIDAQTLSQLLADPAADLLLCDCRFDLARPESGRAGYLAQHLPGAVYLHLDHDLSGPGAPTAGRHPLPDRQVMANRLAALGVGPSTRIVAYDAAGGMTAGRLWWMCRWVGHGAVQVLDGGLAAWLGRGGATASGAEPARPPGHLPLKPALVTAVDYAGLRQALGQPPTLVVDARSADRFRGDNETIDPVAGHIPGAVNRPFVDNLGPDGRFKPASALRDDWLALMGGRSPQDLVQQCGSGVTACHNLLAMAVAGLDGAALYGGSWSEWCRQPDAVIARG